MKQYVMVALVLLGGCASGPRPPAPVQGRPVVQAPRPGAGDLVLGRTAAALVAAFGQPALDVREGTARKLQFLGQNCVLDAYLYPTTGRGEPVVTHVDARLPDGRDTDRAACAATLAGR